VQRPRKKVQERRQGKVSRHLVQLEARAVA